MVRTTNYAISMSTKVANALQLLTPESQSVFVSFERQLGDPDVAEYYARTPDELLLILEQMKVLDFDHSQGRRLDTRLVDKHGNKIDVVDFTGRAPSESVLFNAKTSADRPMDASGVLLSH